MAILQSGYLLLKNVMGVGGGGWIFKAKKFNKLYVHWLEYFILRA